MTATPDTRFSGDLEGDLTGSFGFDEPTFWAVFRVTTKAVLSLALLSCIAAVPVAIFMVAAALP